jgi:hypothetical protein
MGLPADFQALLDYDKMILKSVSNFGHTLRTKDLSYRVMISRRRSDFREVADRRENEKFARRKDRRTREKSEGDYKKLKFESKSNKTGKRREGEKEIPPELPKEKWRKDEKGHMMKRKYRFCQKWHMDYNCPSRLASYHLTVDQKEDMSSDEADIDEVSTDSSEDDSTDSSDSEEARGKRWKPSKEGNMIYQNVYTNVSPGKPESLTIPRANQYRIEEMPMAFSVGTGVSYLSAQPCPIKAWVGTTPQPDQPLQD